MRNSNLYIFTRTTYEQNPPSCGGNWECGSTIHSCMSPSPKKAMNFDGPRSVRHTGVDGVPIMGRLTLKRGSKVIFDRWDSADDSRNSLILKDLRGAGGRAPVTR